MADAGMPSIWGIDKLLGPNTRKLHDVPKPGQQKGSLAGCAATNLGSQLCHLMVKIARILKHLHTGSESEHIQNDVILASALFSRGYLVENV